MFTFYKPDCGTGLQFSKLRQMLTDAKDEAAWNKKSILKQTEEVYKSFPITYPIYNCVNLREFWFVIFKWQACVFVTQAFFLLLNIQA